MKKILYIMLMTAALSGCNASSGEFGMSVRKNMISWNNGKLVFCTEMNPDGRKEYNDVFRASIRTKEGKTIQMPEDRTGLGYGASCPMGISGLYKPENGLSSAEILQQTKERIIIHLKYNKWKILDTPVTLDKQITLFHDSPIMAVIDYYEGDFELLNVAAGLTSYGALDISETENGYILTYPDSITGIIVMPDADERTKNRELDNVLLRKGIENGQIMHYYVGLSDQGMDYLLEKLAEIL